MCPFRGGRIMVLVLVQKMQVAIVVKDGVVQSIEEA